MADINIKCKSCNKEFSVLRTPEIPDNVTSLVCNWCPTCEDTAKDYYMEEYRYLEVDEIKDPNQQSLF